MDFQIGQSTTRSEIRQGLVAIDKHMHEPPACVMKGRVKSGVLMHPGGKEDGSGRGPNTAYYSSPTSG